MTDETTPPVVHCLTRDEDAHWYMIPADQRDAFYTMRDVSSDDLMEKTWGKYRVAPSSLRFIPVSPAD